MSAGFSTLKKREVAAQREQCLKFVALARRLTPPDVKVTFHSGNFGYAALEERKIYVPYLRTARDLHVYLHEVGHILNQPSSDSEAEYQAEVYSFKMMRRAGIPLPRGIRKKGATYVGWFIVDDLLHDHVVSTEALTFVGLKSVHRLTIIRAHAMAVERIGYVPKHEWYGKGKNKTLIAPADAKYWSAVLAAVPAATSSTAAEIEQYEWGQQLMREREEEWADEDSIHYGTYWGD